ncbi:MAG: FAD-dependent oxidoreductase [Myxococcales bacterium]|nr:MAG: FAD-dependent oxidoreductase [Myxococcales bacterium]
MIAKDTLSNTEKPLQCSAVINATGPWTDLTRGKNPRAPKDEMLHCTKGIHVVLPQEKFPLKHAVALFHPRDKRVMFAIPWGDEAYLGTTDTFYEGMPEHVNASREDVDYLIEAAKDFFPGAQASRDDVIATWSGLRPLLRPQHSKGKLMPSQMSREHELRMESPGFFSIAGGKLTTYRKMAKEVANEVVSWLHKEELLRSHPTVTQTKHKPLPGAVGWPKQGQGGIESDLLEQYGDFLSSKTASLLAQSYGVRSLSLMQHAVDQPGLLKAIVTGRAEIMAQVLWAVKEEFAVRLEDVLVRRTQLYFRESSQGLDAVEAVATCMAELLHWSDEQKASEITHYRQLVSDNRHWV